MITVFTPTYNREKDLVKLYESLINQNYKEFEWLVIDDGSKDGTKRLISDLKKENKVNIRYAYKENGGKMSAVNMAYSMAKGDIILGIDSDDILKNNVLGLIANDFEQIVDNKDVVGFCYLQSEIKDKDKIIGNIFPIENKPVTYHEIYNKYKVTGDKMFVMKTDIAKKYEFPIIKGEKFVPEALVFNRISKQYKFLCKNYIVACKEYKEDGYSANYFNLVKKNPKGNALYFKELYEFSKTFYNVYGYILFSIYSKYNFKKIYNEHPAKLKILLLYIPTYLVAKVRK